MEHLDLFVWIVELASVPFFSIAGALMAIRKGLDVLGVVVIGVTTTLGGGVIRDLILGITPPKTFVDPSYATVAAAAALITFIVAYYRMKRKGDLQHASRPMEILMFWLDTLGIAIFTVVGVATAHEISGEFTGFLFCFVGVITGVGGGLLRDILLGNRPYIFVKHFYASACIIGSIVCTMLWPYSGRVIAMTVGAGIIVILRFFAATFRWNMPRVPGFDPQK